MENKINKIMHLKNGAKSSRVYVVGHIFKDSGALSLFKFSNSFSINEFVVNSPSFVLIE